MHLYTMFQIILLEHFSAIVVAEVVGPLQLFLLAEPVVFNLLQQYQVITILPALVLIVSLTLLHSCSIPLSHFPMPIQYKNFGIGVIQ